MYSIEGYEFKIEDFFPISVMEKITDIRVECPEIIPWHAKRRRRRKKITKDGKLAILAADHPARGITSSGIDPMIMGNRQEFLGRIVRVLTDDRFDGVMGTTDVLEELFLVDYLITENGGKSILDDKVLIGCMNRGGLSGCRFEMNDRFTSWTAETLYEMGIDGAKLMFRLDPESEDSGKTIKYCADAINELSDYGITVFLEALAVEGKEKGYKTKKNAEDIVKVVGIATALGKTSRYTWLKIPYSENYEIVAKATTCPILMLGGASKGDPTPVMEEFVKGMKAGKNVRGVLVGRNVIFPGKDDPRAVAGAIGRIVHDGISIDDAIDYLMKVRGKDMDFVRRYVNGT